MRKRGFAPPRVSPPVPQTGAAASYATRAIKETGGCAENRTQVLTLKGWCSTTERHIRSPHFLSPTTPVEGCVPEYGNWPEQDWCRQKRHRCSLPQHGGRNQGGQALSSATSPSRECAPILHHQWWGMRDSNPRSSSCKGDVFSSKLIPHFVDTATATLPTASKLFLRQGR